MESLSRTELRQLVEVSTWPCVSFFMPTHRLGVETQQNPIRLKNLLRTAEQSLQLRGMAPSETERLLAPVRSLLSDYDFWQHQQEGLAVFRSPELFRFYCLDLRVPELAVVAGRFHLKPLLPSLTGGRRFYVLAVTRNRVRFFQGAPESMRELEVEAAPAALSEAAGNHGWERQIQSHSVGPPQSAQRGTVFHGHGGREEDKKVRLLGYLQRVDKAIRELLGPEDAPLVLACVDYLQPLYRRANTCPGLLDEGVVGSPGRLSAQKLHASALGIARVHFQKRMQEAAERYFQLAHTGAASGDLPETLRGASAGRVECLFVTVEVQMWGHYDPATGEVRIVGEAAPEAEDLLNLAALYTYSAGGTVYAVSAGEVPGGGRLAAVFRY